MTEATKRPWGYVHHKGLDKHLVGAVLENVAIVEDRHGNAKENAEFIVKAVNSHDALVAVRDAAKAYYDFTREPEPQGFNHQYNMRAIRVGEALFAALEQVKS